MDRMRSSTWAEYSLISNHPIVTISRKATSINDLAVFPPIVGNCSLTNIAQPAVSCQNYCVLSCTFISLSNLHMFFKSCLPHPPPGIWSDPMNSVPSQTEPLCRRVAIHGSWRSMGLSNSYRTRVTFLRFSRY